ncbi:DUF58 domain-containing protein [Microbacterium kunmingense]|uniref:DUF58 domain-containing protein n=1 Tax=Microbacterium kunmingense TaxID=2915939 RepID=UPI003D758F1A
MLRRLWPLTLRGTGAALLALVCFIVANEVGIPELIYFGMLLVAVLAAAVASLYLTRHADSVTRSLAPDIVGVGRASVVRVRVGVRTALPTPPGTWADSLPAGLDGRAGGVFPALGSGLRGSDRVVDLAYTVTGVRRGIHHLGPLRVDSADPFALARRSTLYGQRTRVTVAPAVIDLPPLTGLAGEAGGTLHTQNNQPGQGADNLIARPYAPGDSMRRIHWRATAHRDELMVRQEEQEATPEATVVLDRGVLRWSTEALHEPGADDAFETAVSACVSVVSRLVRDGYGVSVIDTDGAELVERIDGGDTAAVDDLVTRFATVTARRDDHLPRLARQFAGVMTGPIIVLTGRLDPADVDALAPIVHHSTFAVLLAASPRSGALDRAGDIGWHAVHLDPDGDLVQEWAAAGERGVSRALR